MADVATTLAQWSTTASSNAPAAETNVGSGLGDNIRTLQAVVRAYLAHYNSVAIASAGTTDLGAATGLIQEISGAVAITGLGTVSAGVWKIVRFQDALTLTHNAASLVLPGGANITTAAGDFMLCYSKGSGNWVVPFYQPASGSPWVSAAAGGTAVNALTEDTTPDWAADFLVSYDASAATLKKVLLNTIIPTGTVQMYVGTTAPDSWVLLQGGTLGNAASGGTARANADTAELFTLIYNSMADTEAAVSGGRGANAAADYAANKTITLPDFRGRGPIGTGTGPETAEGFAAGTARTHGDYGGFETHTLTEAELAAHGHEPLGRASFVAGPTGFDTAFDGTSSSASVNDAEYVASTADTGSDDPHANMSPWLALNFIIKL